MHRVERRVYSGVVLEREFFTVRENLSEPGRYEPRPRFKDETERAEHRARISKRNFIRIVNENFTPASRYVTLTFSNDYECHDFKEARALRDRFWNRLRKKVPDMVAVCVMGRGKGTNRIHIHMIIDGAEEDEITSLWNYGDVVDIKHLRDHNLYDGVDHGCDYSALASYMFEHWTPEQGGHRWKGTKNLRKPEKEPMKAVKRNYTREHPPMTPKGYMLVETNPTKYGYISFKYVRIPEPRKRLKM